METDVLGSAGRYDIACSSTDYLVSKTTDLDAVIVGGGLDANSLPGQAEQPLIDHTRQCMPGTTIITYGSSVEANGADHNIPYGHAAALLELINSH